MSISFATTIKPYFTTCYRERMLNFFDLWDPKQVETEHKAIIYQVGKGHMPKMGCPEGVWDPQTRQQFLDHFKAWCDGGFQP